MLVADRFQGERIALLQPKKSFQGNGAPGLAPAPIGKVHLLHPPGHDTPLLVHDGDADQQIFHLAFPGPGIHDNGAAHTARNPGGKLKPGQAPFHRPADKPGQGAARFHPDHGRLRIFFQQFDFRKIAAKENHHARQPLIGNHHIAAPAEHKPRHLDTGQGLHEQRQLVAVPRQNDGLGRPAHLEGGVTGHGGMPAHLAAQEISRRLLKGRGPGRQSPCCSASRHHHLPARSARCCGIIHSPGLHCLVTQARPAAVRRRAQCPRPPG